MAPVASLIIAQGPLKASVHGTCGLPLLPPGQCSDDVSLSIRPDGNLEFPSISLRLPGNYSLEIKSNGFSVRSRTFQILTGQLSQSSIRMVGQPARRTIAGSALHPPPIFEILDEFGSRITSPPNMTVDVFWREQEWLGRQVQTVNESLLAVLHIFPTSSDSYIRYGSIQSITPEPMLIVAKMNFGSDGSKTKVTSTQTRAISVTAGNATSLQTLQAPAVVLADEIFHSKIGVVLIDAYGNPVLDRNISRIEIDTCRRNPAVISVPCNQAFNSSVSNGVAFFTDIKPSLDRIATLFVYVPIGPSSEMILQMQAITVTAGRPRYLRIWNQPVMSISEEPILFQAYDGGTQSFTHVGVEDRLNNMVGYDIPVYVSLQCEYTAELIGIKASTSRNGSAAFMHLVTVLGDRIPGRNLSLQDQ